MNHRTGQGPQRGNDPWRPRHFGQPDQWQRVLGPACTTCGARPLGAFHDGSPRYPLTCAHIRIVRMKVAA